MEMLIKSNAKRFSSDARSMTLNPVEPLKRHVFVLFAGRREISKVFAPWWRGGDELWNFRFPFREGKSWMNDDDDVMSAEWVDGDKSATRNYNIIPVEGRGRRRWRKANWKPTRKCLRVKGWFDRRKSYCVLGNGWWLKFRQHDTTQTMMENPFPMDKSSASKTNVTNRVIRRHLKYRVMTE